MFGIISIFFPSLISIKTESVLLKKTVKKENIIDYCIYCLINNTLTISLFIIIFNNKYDIFNNLNLFPGMCVKYIIVACVNALLISIIKVIVIKNVGFKIEVKKN